MNRERINDENIFGDGVSRSRRDFLRSVGGYSLALAGAMMLAGTQLSIGEAEAAERRLRRKSSSSGSQLKPKLPQGATQQGRLRTTPKLDPKLKGGLADKLKSTGGATCW